MPDDDSTLIPKAEDGTVDLSRVSTRPGDRVGRYTIRQVLGEGGFGVVYEAEQTEPVKRRVALKVIKPGMDSKGVIARFEAERQALALMDHPHVAKVFDGGLTERGLPYFAMELVKGEPIHQFCDRQRLGIEDRLKLMMRVCAAVQHAHTKGIIHRDLKPANILVTYGGDEEPSPKVIDFGVAKAINQPLTEATIFTERGQLIGTPEYMSPEQAEMGATDIDTRSDVYSLGVLLYELLTGSRPFEPATLRAAGFDEIRRIIREVDPQKPSTRLSSLVSSGEDEETVSRITKARRTEVRSLTSTLRRDLDWVVMKCLEKDRQRRYETASELASELGRYLAGDTVFAGPPSVRYKLGKFVHRHRIPVVATLTIGAILFSGVLALAWLSMRLTSSLETERESRRRSSIMLADLLSASHDNISVDPTSNFGRTVLNAGSVLEYAWSLRTEAGDETSLAACRDLCTLGEHFDDERGTKYWDEVGDAIATLNLADPLATPNDRHGFRLHMWSDPFDAARRVYDRLCVLRLKWSNARGDTEEVDRIWSIRRDIALTPGVSVHHSSGHFGAIAAFAEYCLETDQPERILAIESDLQRIAKASTSMSSGGAWKEPRVNALVSLAIWKSGDRNAAKARLRDDLANRTYAEYGVMAFRQDGLEALAKILRDEGTSDELAAIEAEIASIKDGSWYENAVEQFRPD